MACFSLTPSWPLPPAGCGAAVFLEELAEMAALVEDDLAAMVI
jgi:hypothetical protein